MCWNQEVSLSVAAAGFVGSAYLRKQTRDPYCWTPVAYFASMELLQGLTYFVINECQNPFNQILTVASYLHICFQPIFSNIFFLYFISPDRRRKALKWVMPIAGVSALLVLQKLYIYEGCTTCHPQEIFCADKVCSYFANWHIGWQLVMNGNSLYIPDWVNQAIPGNIVLLSPHFVSMFVLPFFYGVYWPVIFLFLTGPYFAMSVTDDKNEWASIWCLFSTTQMSIMLFSLRTRDSVSHWMARLRRKFYPRRKA